MAIWVYKEDGTLQCGRGKEIPLQAMQEQLAQIVGGKEILRSEKRHLPIRVSQLCGMPTASVNSYELTEKGARELFTGIVGKAGFKLWIWPNPKESLLAGGDHTFPFEPLSDRDQIFPFKPLVLDGDDLLPWPWSPDNLKNKQIAVSLVQKMYSANANPVLVRELIGMQCRVFGPGHEIGTGDWLPGRINIFLNEHGIIEDITFG